MLKYTKNDRQDYNEFLVSHGASLLGFCTEFKNGWTFRAAEGYLTPIKATQLFETKEEAATTAVPTLRKYKQEPPKKRLKGKLQRVPEVVRDFYGNPVLDENGDKIPSGTMKTIRH